MTMQITPRDETLLQGAIRRTQQTLGNGEIHAVLQATTRLYRRDQIRPQHSYCGHPYQPYRIPKPHPPPIPENSGPLIFPYFRLSFLLEIWGSGNHRKENR